jgi:hypothetical protein
MGITFPPGGAAYGPWRSDPRSPSGGSQSAPRFQESAAVRWGIQIGRRPAVLDPLHRVPWHIVETEGIGRKCIDLRRASLQAVAAAFRVNEEATDQDGFDFICEFVATVASRVRDTRLVAPPPRGRGSSTGGIFSLRFRWQPVRVVLCPG